jgi:HlyD family secretion protein
MNRTKSWISTHKKVAFIIVLLVLAGGVYGSVKVFGSSSSETRYVLQNVTTGNIISSVTGSGQVSASNQFSLVTKASGQLIVLNAGAGQEVKQGALIAEVDPGTAGLQLESAKLSYDKTFTVDPDTLVQNQNSVSSASSSVASSYTKAVSDSTTILSALRQSESDLEALYNNGGYLNFSSSYSFTVSDLARTAQQNANGAYYDAQSALNTTLTNFQSINTNSSPANIDAALQSVSHVVNMFVIAANDAQTAADDIRLAGTDTTKDEQARTTIASIVSSVNTQLNTVTSDINSISSAKQALQEAQNNLATLQAGPDAVTASQAELSVQEQEQAYSNYFTYAPFDGILANVSVQKGDTVNSGATIGTFITKDQIANVSLNEVDVTKVKVGQKATLTFDAVDGLTLTGEVAEVDQVGTVSQGVVSYNVKIAFDTTDDRVKSGMSVSAAIITDTRQNVIVIPTSAIKSASDGSSYVQVFNPPLADTGSATGVASTVVPANVTVETGLSDDTNTEITSGLKEGDQIVIKTIVATKTTTSAAAPSILSSTRTSARTGTGGGFGGGAGGGAGFSR